MEGKIFLGFMGLVFFCVAIYSASTAGINGEPEDCYDRNNNKILGEKCVVENSFNSREMAYLLLGGVGFAMMIFLIFIGHMIDETQGLNRSRWSEA